ncbi:MAG TPA: DUF6519 domain-containing protein [Anaerolineae bacterium]|nr:DUF6519 domain-containing protein [Anaerolineae bacterium]
MKGDFTRSTFRSEKHYSSVRMQQGRVQLDADWNEHVEIQTHLAQAQSVDVIGPWGAPNTGGGFRMGITPDGNDLTISAGRMYVDGILCENEAEATYMQQPDLPEPTGVRPLLDDAQTAHGLVYLDVWQRHITALEDPHIREVALGGPDTSTRTQTVWQVKVAPLQPFFGMDCDSQIKEWDDLIALSSGKMVARAQPAPTVNDPCLVPPGAGYRRLENQLYRVEVHRAGELGQASFKWSRDNGSVVARWLAQDGARLTVSSIGRDAVSGFASGQLVELTDDTHELTGQPGTLVRLVKVEGQVLTIDAATATGPVDRAQFPRNPKVRRWDSPAEMKLETPTKNLGFIALEDGIEVKFEAGSYRTGDYWLIPARTATGDIDWPPVPSPDSGPPSQPPLGVRHHYARLALIQLNPNDNQWSVQDCRKVFPTLTDLPLFPALHVTDMSIDQDEVIALDQFKTDGLSITLDGVPDPVSINASSVIVTLEAPFPNASGAAMPAINFILEGALSVSKDTVAWHPTQPVETLIKSGTNARVRVTLKGHAIWSEQDGERRYLDGQAFGRPALRTDNKTPRTAFAFPSGARARASDFEAWFFVGVPVAQTPLVKVGVVRVLDTGGKPTRTDAPETARLTDLKQPIPIQQGDVIEVQFVNAPVNSASVVDGSSFVVRNQAGAIQKGQIVAMKTGNAIRWVMPSLNQGKYRVTLTGEGANAITSQQGRRLDGDPVGLPSGNEVEGGNFTFEFEIIVL